MIPHPRLTLALVAVLLLLVVVGVLLRPRTTPPVGACTHFASPQGTGTACTEAAPCQVASWWPLARPGSVLCLLDGTYRGQASMLDPPDSLSGTPAQPITIRALHDGQVLLDAEHQRSSLALQPGNEWFVVEGLNATNGKESAFYFGGSHGRGRRLIAWHGTEGQANSYAFALGRQVDNVVEDCAAWGLHMRKLFDGGQSQAPGEQSQWSGYRRCWGEWNGWPGGESQPTNTYQLGYRTRQQRYENVLGTWDMQGARGNPDGILSFFYDCEAASLSVLGTQLLGSLFYLRPGAVFAAASLLTAFCTSDAAWRDVAAVLPPGYPDLYPFSFLNQTSVAVPMGNVCTQCLSVYQDGQPSRVQPQAGWTLPGWREGRTLEEATGGQSVYTLLPGLCTRSVGGVLTTEPLWPWPMNQRILEARAASGAAAVDVTAEVERVLGPIPDACRSDRMPPHPEPVPPGATLACQGDLLAGGKIALTCTPQGEGRR